MIFLKLKFLICNTFFFSLLTKSLKLKTNFVLFLIDLDFVSLRNKAVYDLDDPNRPRFTTSELKEILQERNDLKAKISDLEDELELYRPKNSSTL